MRVAGALDPSVHWYLELLTTRLGAAWQRPARAALGADLSVEVGFRLGRDGSLSDLRVTRPSGDDRLDRSARTAVERSAPFRPLPEKLGGESGEDFFLVFVVR